MRGNYKGQPLESCKIMVMKFARKRRITMARKGENIRKRKDGRWEARYMKGRKPDGKICYGYLYAPTYRVVSEKKRLMVVSMDGEQ